MTQATTPRWYCVNIFGVAMLCASKNDAVRQSKQHDCIYPTAAPHRAVQLVEYVEPKPGLLTWVDVEPGDTIQAGDRIYSISADCWKTVMPDLVGRVRAACWPVQRPAQHPAQLTVPTNSQEWAFGLAVFGAVVLLCNFLVWLLKGA